LDPGPSKDRLMFGRRTWGEGARETLERLWLIVFLLLVWEVLARWAGSLFVSPPSRIAVQAFEDWVRVPASGWADHLAVAHVLPSLWRMTLGWTIAATVGVAVGVLLGLFRTASELLAPMVRFGMSIPPPALLPFSIVLLGIGDAAKVFLIAFGCLWPVLLNAIDGARSVDPTLRRTAQTLRLTRRSTLRFVILPAAAPQIFAGLRVSLSVALILMVVSEMFAATSGVGFLIVNAQRSFRTLPMWSGIFLLAVLGVSLNKLFLYGERRVLRWHYGMRAISTAD
jgi:ABC-type nitrate/sulfonate/bicarbonate transport system permease component